MATYQLTDKIREIFRKHNGNINSDELEQALSDLMIPKPDVRPNEKDGEPVMPVVEPSPEKQLYDKMYPSLKDKKRI